MASFVKTEGSMAEDMPMSAHVHGNYLIYFYTCSGVNPIKLFTPWDKFKNLS